MAPLCECGHRASEHHKFSANLRTWCKQDDGTAGGAFEESWDCGCLMYKPEEQNDG